VAVRRVRPKNAKSELLFPKNESGSANVTVPISQALQSRLAPRKTRRQLAIENGAWDCTVFRTDTALPHTLKVVGLKGPPLCLVTAARRVSRSYYREVFRTSRVHHANKAIETNNQAGTANWVTGRNERMFC
jgi:hypothetical protein